MRHAIKDDLPHLGPRCVVMFGSAAGIGESSRLRWGHVNLPGNRNPDELVFDYAGRGSVWGRGQCLQTTA